ncbi:hypothetical protein [Nostoc sp. LPT]|uniref:hypothetical protein n=1 Tax=Nostoc sp. LPT TaxID=2815387 RepID=UPI001DF5C394|nr:hypothetical protein [Nostoc sp. LPT]MBN4003580.1 hypothetical protein [Nostoc sp. LPT]
MLAALRFSSQYHIIRKPISHFYICEKSSQYGCSNNSYCISYFGFYIIERLKKFLHPAQKSRLDDANTWSYPDYKDIT